MIKLIIFTVLVASTTAIPRSRGEPLHASRQLHSQANFQVNPQLQQSANQPSVATFQVDPNNLVPKIIPNPSPQQPPVATFQVNPNNLQPQRVENIPANQNLQAQQPGTFQINPNTLQSQGIGNSPSNQNIQSPQPISFQVNPNTLQPQKIENSPVQPNTFQNLFNQQANPQPVGPSSNQARPTNNVNTASRLTITAPPLFMPPPITEGNINTGINLPLGDVPISFPDAELAKRLIGNPPGGALLIGSNPPLFPIEKRLISNYTKLRANVVDTFRCSTQQQPNYAGYGYYADVDNECQIFHICLPWHELYPTEFSQEVTYQFSFICPNQTVFSQDTMNCMWKSEAFSCQDSPQLYWLNRNFFRVLDYKDGEFGKKIPVYAQLNSQLTEPLTYDHGPRNQGSGK